MTQQVEQTVEVSNRQGLHARPAAEFVKLASRFEAEVTVEKDGLEVNGKSIMGVMMLAAEPGAQLAIRADGPDGGRAVEALVGLVEGGFEEAYGDAEDADDGDDGGDGGEEASGGSES